MSETKMYSTNEVCEELGITIYTLTNWYNWQRKMLKEGIIDEPYLPEPVKLEHAKGKPRRWSEDMLNDLIEFKKNIVVGRNGIYGMYSNPFHKDTKKYKKSIETKEE